MIGTLFCDERIVAPGHEGAVVRMFLFHGDFLDHSLDRCQLVSAAKGHKHRACTDGGVKAFAESAFGAAVEIGSSLPKECAKRTGDLFGPGLRRSGDGVDVLLGSVGIQEGTGDIDDLFPIPLHDEPGLCLNNRDRNSLEVFFLGKCQERCCILRLYHDSHTLLALADGEFRTVKTVIFFGNSIEIDAQPLRQLSDGDRDTAGPEVIAALDHSGSNGIAEETLKLSLLGCIALLDLSTAGFNRLSVMSLAGAGGTADTIPAGSSAQQDDNIAGSRTFSADILLRCGSDDGSDLHALGGIARVIELIHDAGGQTDLVSVRRVTCCGCRHQFALGELAGHCFRNRLQGIGGSCDAHGSIDVRAAGKRITDRPADTGGGSAEGLDLRGVVVGFILEEQKPWFSDAVCLNLDFHGAGVNFLRFIELWELAGFFQRFDRHSRQIHETDRFRAVQCGAGVQIIPPCLFQEYVLKAHTVYNRIEGRVTAVIGPVGIQNADLGDGWITLFFIPEIGLAKGNIVCVHGEAVLTDKVLQRTAVECTEAVQRGNFSGYFILYAQRGRFLQRCFTCFHRVNDIFFDLGELRFRERPVERIDPGGTDERPFSTGKNLDALGSRIRPLVELAGKIFNSKYSSLTEIRRLAHEIKLRLGKHGSDSISEQLFRNLFCIITIEQAHFVQPADTEEPPCFLEQSLRLVVQTGLLLNKDPIDHVILPSRHAGRAVRYPCGNMRFQSVPGLPQRRRR